MLLILLINYHFFIIYPYFIYKQRICETSTFLSIFFCYYFGLLRKINISTKTTVPAQKEQPPVSFSLVCVYNKSNIKLEWSDVYEMPIL